MPGVEDEHPVEKFSTEAAYPPFHDRICTGRPDRSRDDPYPLAGEDRVEHAGELRIPIPDHEPELFHTIAQVHEQSAGLLGDPVRGGMCSDTEDVDPAGGVLDNCEAVQPREEHGVAMKEVAGENPVRLAAQELGPGGTRASWGRIETGTFEDRPDRGGADLTAHAGEFSGDAPVSPVRVLVGEAQNQPAQRW